MCRRKLRADSDTRGQSAALAVWVEKEIEKRIERVARREKIVKQVRVTVVWPGDALDQLVLFYQY